MKIDPKIKEELRRFLNRELEKRKRQVVIVSPYKLKEDELKMIFKHFPFLSKDRVRNVVDKNLIGGVVIKFKTKVIDLSIKNQLKDLEKKLYEIN